MTKVKRGKVLAAKTPSLSLGAVYRAPGQLININCCGDVDCGNFGIAFQAGLQTFKGPGAQLRLQTALLNNPSLALGKGKYKLDSSSRAEDERLSTEFE